MIRLEINFINDSNGVFSVRNDIARYTMYGIPRDRIQEAINNLPTGLQGIYFLVNTDEGKKDNRYLYIGQTKQGPVRLIDHKAKRDEWNMAYMFLADKEDISLQIADELEAYEISRFLDSGKYKIENSRPNKATCSPIAQMFSESIEDVMSFFGYDVYRVFKSNDLSLADDIYIINRNGNKGMLKIINGKYYLLKNSLISQNINEEQIPDKNVRLRDELLYNNKLVKDGIYYRTTEDLEFDSPSAVSSFVIGHADNGWISFKNNQGKTLDELFRK